MVRWLEGESGNMSAPSPSYDMKTCPQCGAEVFCDMDLCYGCLYEFAKTDIEPPDALAEEQVPTEAYEAQAIEAMAGEREPQVCLHIQSRSIDVVLPLPREGLTVGRGSECGVRLHNRAVSRKHVRLEPAGDRIRVRDLGARNAALLNDLPVPKNGETYMQSGDLLRICSVRFSVGDSPD